MTVERSEALIAQLARDLPPVRRLPPPGLLALLWLAAAILVNLAAVAIEGLRPDLMPRASLPQEAAQFLASVATGIAAALAAAMLARPDRSPAWALLPLGPLALWLAALGAGSLADAGRMGAAAFAVGTSWGCVRYILGVGGPLLAALLLLLRHAGPVRPLPVLLLGGLATASLCSAGLTLCHHLDTMLMILIWHGGALAALVVLGWAVGPRLMLRALRR